LDDIVTSAKVMMLAKGKLQCVRNCHGG